MTDYMKMDAPTMLNELGDNAAKWGAAFRQTAIKLGYSDMDESWLIGWFANAIENSWDRRTGHIHNGDHLQYLIDNDMLPVIDPAPPASEPTP